MFSALDPGSSGSDSSVGESWITYGFQITNGLDIPFLRHRMGHGVVFSGKTFNSHSASLHPGV